MNARQQLAAAITPGLEVADPLLAGWLAEVNLRLRREVAWCWYQRAGQSAAAPGMLPPVADAAAESLDQIRYLDDKQRFFAEDPAARYLSEQLSRRPDAGAGDSGPGSWSWLVAALGLDPGSQFVLALALAARLDAALSPVFAACMNDLSRPYPTLALAQRLWDAPRAIAACADLAHPLYAKGLLTVPEAEMAGTDWQRALQVPAMVARTLLEPAGALPAGLRWLEAGGSRELGAEGDALAQRLLNQPPQRLQIVPLLAARDTDFTAWAASLNRIGKRPLATVADAVAPERMGLTALATVCWLRGIDLLLPSGWLPAGHSADDRLSPLQGIPARWFVPVEDRRQLDAFPSGSVLPAFSVPPLGFEARLELLRDGLGHRGARLGAEVEECARRFRLQERALQRVLSGLAAGPLSAAALKAACRNEALSEMAGLAQPVIPRFSAEELVLPPAQQEQFEEIVRAMRALTTVHYRWGSARAWSEGGLAVLFCGPPGTGKTMGAEALAAGLDLPMYRVDLSQVVNKYIGETEKNLKRIFDGAELSDCVLFFDEADALFGKRTDVKDAHDRFANIEISYLLERMERFKGLAILATNRRRDLDEAFLRRLRYIVEFPLPGVAERERIWRGGFPPKAYIDDLDFGYLARQFPLSGGHIRSIIFNACLQSAAAGGGAEPPAGKAGRVGMPELLLAVRRELEKMNRTAGPEQFGSYGHLLETGA